jgi:hypothetical protein
MPSPSLAVMAAAEQHDGLLGGYYPLAAYHVYSNTGAGDPINYSSVRATTGLFSWTPPALAAPGIWRFGIRAFDPLTLLEEENLDSAVTIVLNSSAADITQQPKAPSALRVFARSGGAIRVEWAYNTINPSPVPTGFHVYIGASGPPSYITPAATVGFPAAVAGSFMADLTGLSGGTVYTVGVRAYNSTAEEQNTVTVNCTALVTGPAAGDSLTATAI